jgi:arylsulfatase A-like enzyme
MKRSGTGLVVCMVLVALGIAMGIRARPKGGTTPVVLITIDTLRADRLGCLGSGKALTPNLDRLAAEGAVFEDASSASPLTLPSHATILTGLLPPRHGLRDNDTPRALPVADVRDFLTAAEILKSSHGYETAAFVSGSPLSPRWGLGAGFDVYDAPPEGEAGALALGERRGGETIDRALGWVRGRKPRRPFFLWVHLFDPHHPYDAPGGAGLPHDAAAAYEEEVAYADAQVGRLIEELRTSGVLDRAVVVVCSDHGEGLGEHGEATHGHFLHRSTLRVPLLFRAPGVVPAGARPKVPVSLVDVLPTMLDAARRPLTPGLLDGRSLLPLLRGGEGAAAEPSPQYAETVYPWRAFRWAPGVSLRAGALRVIDHAGDRREAYDLVLDPGEVRDLGIGAPPAAAKIAEDAWSVFGSPPRTRGSGAAPGSGPELAGIPYVSPYSPLVVLPAAEYAKLPLPSPAFLRQFEAALLQLDRARTLEDSGEAGECEDEAIRLLKGLEAEQPQNPAPRFWLGRAYRQRAKAMGQAANPKDWSEAFFKFQESGRLGYRESRTVSLMMEAAFQAGKKQDLLRVAREAVEVEKMDGDAGFWGWVSLAWIVGGTDPSGVLPAEARAKAREALDRARARVRSELERGRIAEIEAFLR